MERLEERRVGRWERVVYYVIGEVGQQVGGGEEGGRERGTGW